MAKGIKAATKKELQTQKKILQDNINMQVKMLARNKSYTDKNGKTYTSNHYRKAVMNDMIELGNINKQLKKYK